MSQPTEGDRYVCPKAEQSGRPQHRATYRNGKMLTSDWRRCRSTCDLCGAEIKRAHQRSSQWLACVVPSETPT